MKHSLQLLSAAALVAGAITTAQAEDTYVYYTLESAGEDAKATARVVVYQDYYYVLVENAHPKTMYTVWVDFRNRAAGKELPDGFPVDLAQPVGPAIGSIDPVYNGMQLDLNAFVTDENGNAKFYRRLDYHLLEENASPVTGMSLSMQGLNRIGGYWLRVFDLDPEEAASQQVVDDRNRPVLVRSTAQGFTIVRHPDFISHGHTPGVKNVDHFSAFFGDFPVPGTRMVSSTTDKADAGG